MDFPEMKTTVVFKKTLLAYRGGKRLIVHQGGTSSSKTYSTLQVLILIAMTSTVPLIISVVSESVPHLRRGVIRDMQKIMGAAFDPEAFNKTEHIYTFGISIMEFFSADDSSKLRGGRRDILFINEGNNIFKESFDELDVRTRLCSIVDYNPTCDFWLHEILTSKGINDFSTDSSIGDTVFIHSTYKDARSVLPETVVANIESRKDRDPNWWRVYGLGLVGKIEGLIHPTFSTIKDFPKEGVEGYGLDFGFNDPAALVRCKVIGDTLVSEELLYETGLTNQDLDKKFTDLGLIKGRSEIIADSAEPKSIEELYRMGWNIKPSIKGQDSVVAGIQKINQYRQIWTENSTNGIKEQRNYMWDKDKNGKILDSEDKSEFNHLMAARRYYLANKTLGAKGIFDYNIGDERRFTVNWNQASGGTLHYGGFCLMPNNTLYAVYSLWDNKDGMLFIYGAKKYDQVIPEDVARDIIRTAKVKYVQVNKFLCNEVFLASGKSVSKLIIEALREQQAPNRFTRPFNFDLYGSIAYMNSMFAREMVMVHCDLPEFSAQIAGWTFKDNGTDVRENQGYCEALCLIASELKRDISSKKPLPLRQDYRPTKETKEEFKQTWQVA